MSRNRAVKGKQELPAAPEESPHSFHSRALQRSKVHYLVLKHTHYHRCEPNQSKANPVPQV